MSSLPTTAEQYQAWLDAQQKYKKQQTGGASFLQALQTALAGADNQNTALRQQQQNLVQQQFETPTKYREELISQGITDPYQRQALLNEKLGNVAANLTGVQGKLADLGGQRADVLKTAGSAYDAETVAALQQAQSAGDFFKTLLGQEQAAKARKAEEAFATQQMLAQQKFQSRNDALERQKMLADIAATNRSNRRSNRGDGVIDFKSLLDLINTQQRNPIAALIAAGGNRTSGEKGGFNFFGKQGEPITVEQAAAMVPGSSIADLLAGSTNAQDTKLVTPIKPPTQTQKLADNNAQSGLRSLNKIETLYNETANRNKTVGLSRIPFGAGNPKAQQYNSARKEITDIIARLRTGAVINEQEEKLYKTYVPGPSDTEENAWWKISQLKQFLTGLTIDGGGAITPDISGANDPEYQAYLRSQGVIH